MGFTMGLNFILLIVMVATNIISLYHLSSTVTSPNQPPPTPVPDYLLRQLNTIRATINHLTRHHNNNNKPTTSPKLPEDLILYSHIGLIASSCHNHPELLHKYMTYTPFSTCPYDTNLQETLILNGCHPLPRRRCFSKTPSSSSSKPISSLLDSHAQLTQRASLLKYTSDLDLTLTQFMQLAKSANSAIRLGIDVGGGTGTFAALMKESYNVTILTTTMNVNAPYNEAVASRGLIPLHVPLQQRFPVFDGTMDLVRCGRAVNRWIPVSVLEFMFYDVDRVLRGGGYLWVDRFFSKGIDLEKVYGPLIGKLGYKKVKWAVDNKTDPSGLKHGEVYLTALLQKPVSRS